MLSLCTEQNIYNFVPCLMHSYSNSSTTDTLRYCEIATIIPQEIRGICEPESTQQQKRLDYVQVTALALPPSKSRHFSHIFVVSHFWYRSPTNRYWLLFDTGSSR